MGRKAPAPPPSTTSIARPLSVSTSCLAMSLASSGRSAGIRVSHSQCRWAVLAYRAAGVAWVTRTVVTSPVRIPAV